jgi:hypothetical protein
MRTECLHSRFCFGLTNVGSCCDASCLGSCEEPVLGAEREGPYGALCGIVGYLQPAIDEIAGQRRPARACVADDLCEIALAEDLGEEMVNEGGKICHDGQRQFLARLAPGLEAAGRG